MPDWCSSTDRANSVVDLDWSAESPQDVDKRRVTTVITGGNPLVTAAFVVSPQPQADRKHNPAYRLTRHEQARRHPTIFEVKSVGAVRGGVSPELMVCRCSPRSSLGFRVGFAGWLTAAALRQGWAGHGEAPRSEALPAWSARAVGPDDHRSGGSDQLLVAGSIRSRNRRAGAGAHVRPCLPNLRDA